MKIVCGSCQAKYSIADEKVAGKVFRIRCKRCGEVIVVRGDQDSPEAAAGGGAAAPQEQSQDNERTVQGPTASQSQLPASASETPADAIWHVVINGEQAGPYAPSQLGELVASGQLDWEAYVWCEGFENWQPMRDVPDLVNAISGGQPAAQGGVPVAMGRPAATANTQMGRDPFADEAPAQQVFAKAAGGTGGVVHTSSRQDPGGASALSSFDSAGPSSPSVGLGSSGGGQGPRVTTQQAMTGSRNENSVLFSLKNLQALATGSVPPAAPTQSVRPGHAAGEGSGLIDIRALATTTGADSKNSEKDALLALGSAQAGAFGGLGSPMLTPAGKADDEENKKPLIFAIIGGCAFLAVAGIAMAFILRGGSSTPAEVTPVAPVAAPAAAPGSQPSAAAPTAQPATPQPAAELSEGELAAARAAAAAKAQAEAAAAAKPAEEPGGNRPSAPQHAGGKHPSSASNEKAPEPAAAATPAPAAKPADKPKGNSSIDDLLNDAIGGKSNSLGAKPVPAADLPEKPSRDDVLKAMKGVTDPVKACAGGQVGVAFANITVIGKTGRVGNVEITGVSGEPGSCMAKAVRKAVFPKFSAENFQVKFPFRL